MNIEANDDDYVRISLEIDPKFFKRLGLDQDNVSSFKEEILYMLNIILGQEVNLISGALYSGDMIAVQLYLLYRWARGASEESLNYLKRRENGESPIDLLEELMMINTPYFNFIQDLDMPDDE